MFYKEREEENRVNDKKDIWEGRERLKNINPKFPILNIILSNFWYIRVI